MLEELVYIDIGEGEKIIQARIIDLNNQKLNLESDIEHFKNRLELGVEKKNVESTKVKIRRLNSRLTETRKMLAVNQQLLGFDDRHEYQLEN